MNARTKGHSFERDMAFKLRLIWPDCRTSRFMGALWLDHSGVDLVGTPGYNIQLKALERAPAYHDILASMPQGKNKNIIIHKRNNKGIVVVIGLDDFLELLKNGTKH